MYNGIGLETTRGSGTNGYVQRNLSHLRNPRDKRESFNDDNAKRFVVNLILSYFVIMFFYQISILVSQP